MSSYDITFCNRKCANYECKRNQKHLEGYNGCVSIADFYECEDFKNGRT